MIEELLKAKRITPEEMDLYTLFAINELGRKCLDRMIEESFMDEPQDKEFTSTGFAFFDGRRSVFRDIRLTIQKVQKLIKEAQYAGQPEQSKPSGIQRIWNWGK